jgi:hypothetical protein
MRKVGDLRKLKQIAAKTNPLFTRALAPTAKGVVVEISLTSFRTARSVALRGTA